MARRVSTFLDDAFEVKFDEYRRKHYPGLNRSEAVGMLVKTALLSMPAHNDVTAQRALLKAEQSVYYAREIIRTERNKLEQEPTLLLSSPTTQPSEEQTNG